MRVDRKSKALSYHSGIPGKLFYIACILFAGLLFACSTENNRQVSLQSPDGNIEISLHLNHEQAPEYTMTYKGKPVIERGIIGIKMAESGLLSKSLKLFNTKFSVQDEEYPLFAGKSSKVRDDYHQMVFEFRETNQKGRKILVKFRVFNDGAAFRLIIPNQEAVKDYHVKNDHNVFRFPANTLFWTLNLESFHNHYEKRFFRKNFQDINTDSTLLGLPLTFKIGENIEGALTEANLTNYAGMYLKTNKADSSFYSMLAPHPEDDNIAVKLKNEVVTPWRLVMVSDKALNLIGSNTITSLNEPCSFKETSWIKPGKSAWDWWNYQTVPEDAGFESGMNNETMKYFIDFAAEFNLEYMMVDAKWYGDHKDSEADITTSIDDINVPELVKYGRERNVDILLWVNWKCLDRQMDEAMALYEQWGVKGIKVDYMNRDDQEMVGFYHKVLEKAAKYHLLVNFHGAYKPTGIRRTYPNLMTREGIMGLEHSRWSSKVTPEHNVTIPFTRMLTGPMDYTPGGFRNVTREEFAGKQKPPMVMGTRCHNLAMFVVYLSPLQMVSDWPGAYRGEKGADFLKVVPASWDETRPLEGEIGDYIIMARRKGDEWFLGGMTDDTERQLNLALSFLSGEKTYQATIYQDAPVSDKKPKELEIVKKTFSNTDKLNIKMATGGGIVVHFYPEK